MYITRFIITLKSVRNETKAEAFASWKTERIRGKIFFNRNFFFFFSPFLDPMRATHLGIFKRLRGNSFCYDK